MESTQKAAELLAAWVALGVTVVGAIASLAVMWGGMRATLRHRQSEADNHAEDDRRAHTLFNRKIDRLDGRVRQLELSRARASGMAMAQAQAQAQAEPREDADAAPGNKGDSDGGDR